MGTEYRYWFILQIITKCDISKCKYIADTQSPTSTIEIPFTVRRNRRQKVWQNLILLHLEAACLTKKFFRILIRYVWKKMWSFMKFTLEMFLHQVIGTCKMLNIWNRVQLYWVCHSAMLFMILLNINRNILI